MPTSLFDLKPLTTALENGDPIITANDRLRRHLLNAWDQRQMQNGQRVWASPPVWLLDHWLAQQWQILMSNGSANSDRAPASAHQRHWLWELVISQSDAAQTLLQAEPLAQQADTALRSLMRWEIEPDTLEQDLYLNANNRAFLEWQRRFNQRLASRQLMMPEMAHRRVADAFAEGELPRLPRLWLLGFDDIPPLYQRLFEAASDDVHRLMPAGVSHNRTHRVTVPDVDTELSAAALWSLQQLEQDPDASIGIIVPDLGQRRDQVERFFSEVFEPGSLLPDQPRRTPPFNFSAGVPLGSTPLIHSALGLLGLLRDQWPLNDVCALLHTPFWGDPERELVLRTHWSTRLRETGKFDVTGTDLRTVGERLAEQLTESTEADLEYTGDPIGPVQRLQQIDELRRRFPSSASARFWAGQFQRTLNVLGWPGPRRLDSVEYQQAHQWGELLELFATLEATGADLSLPQALTQLAQLARQTHFQAQTPDSPIQILGALEGAGLRFSHCWVVGLHQRQWPPAPAPSPLLPLELQRDKRMPHASAERELDFARSLTRHYEQCAETVVFSCARADEQGDLAPSPLIRSIPETTLSALIRNSASADTSMEGLEKEMEGVEGMAMTGRSQFRASLAEHRALEVSRDRQGPRFDTEQNAPGGSSLFKQQAACPFNAFAQLRLGARLPDPPVVGLSPAERGTLLHGVLAEVWKVLQDSESLANYDENELKALIAQLSERTLAPIRRRRPRELGPEYCALELERTQGMVERWLQLEKQRPPFRVIATEQRRQIQFQGLKLTLFIDRIDELSSGERLLIDYKTGAELNPSQWLGERPDEPQLPLYTVTDDLPVAGVAFAQLNPKATQWIGLGQVSTPPPGIKPADDWDALQDEWRTALTALAEAFIAGEASVDFKDANAQRFSGQLLPLNRWLEKDTVQRYLTEHGAAD
ncbi:PD-(D/E)XK nuclease family protein [Marinimicrobium sp. ARAG 43.8]|uniref:PD-(D/E)XK nuclease family protein n=1 Tax=Marinimicrobium sp. ARAG 43.8 TaxID=3418719 RepID=UPI003CFA5B2A